MAFVASKHDHLKGRVVGTGHCVAFVREVTGAPHTSQWRRGAKVRGSDAVPGTAIATFDSRGRYANATNGTSHAAVLISINADGLRVADQWVGRAVRERLIRYRGGNGLPADDGDAYSVIEV